MAAITFKSNSTVSVVKVKHSTKFLTKKSQFDLLQPNEKQMILDEAKEAIAKKFIGIRYELDKLGSSPIWLGNLKSTMFISDCQFESWLKCNNTKGIIDPVTVLSFGE
jgi:hypothetical protein